MKSRSAPFAIVLCTYNGEAHLDAQMRTLRQQDGVAEIIVNDDGSTDATMDILAAHAAEDPRIRIEQNRRRLGVTANFEQAIQRVRSPWIALSDQDDLWVDGKLARMCAAWDGRSCLLHHATHKFRGAAPAVLPSPAGERRKFAGEDLRRLLFRNSVVGHTVLVRTEAVQRLLPLPTGVPHDWWIGLGIAAGGSVQYVDEFLVHYRIHANNSFHAAGSRWRRLRGEHDLRLRVLQAVERHLQLRESERRFVREYINSLRLAERRRRFGPLWRFYRRNAPVLFGTGDGSRGFLRRERKCFTAVLGALVCSRRSAGALERKAVSPWTPSGQPAE